MRILFVQTNMNSSLMPLPIGAAMAAWRLRREGHDVRFLDLMGERDAVATARRSTMEFRPDLACFSIRNRDNQSLLNNHDPLPGIRLVFEAVREASIEVRGTPVPALLGGTAFTTFPERMLDYFSADYGLAGDALAPLAAFVRSLENGVISLDTPGLVYRDTAGIIRCNPFHIEGYREVDTGYHELIDRRRYRRTYWDAAVITRSGCPENCIYCDTYRTFGQSFMLREPEAIAEEVAMLRRTRKVRSVWLVDPGEGDEEFFHLYRRAGGGAFMMFAESLSDSMLEGLDKSFRYEQVRRDALAIRAAGLDFMLMPTLGSPGETPATVEETLTRAPGLGAASTDFGIGWRIQPGTALRRRAVEERVIDSDDDCWNAHFYISPETPLEYLRDRLRRFRRRNFLLPMRKLPFAARMTMRTMSV